MIVPTYSICDRCIEEHFPGMTKDEALEKLNKGFTQRV
jgi:hypothetical protein